ncbi:MAG TPA: hypothetical protein VNF47_23445 [Streptosporangiaceae bacterium]|nr:hypothetical protein [Streptosporangiaceae bacterium]
MGEAKVMLIDDRQRVQISGTQSVDREAIVGFEGFGTSNVQRQTCDNALQVGKMAAMDDAGELLNLVGSGVDDQPILTELGRVVIGSTVLEYRVACLVALTEGIRGRAVDDRALEIVKQTGAARSQLAHLAKVRPRIKWLCDDSNKLLEARNILVHSLVTGRGQDNDVYAAAIYSARHDTVEFITAHVVARHADYFEQNCTTLRRAINAELAGELTGQSPSFPPLDVT